MAGAGKRTFIAGEVLTAAQVNDYLMDQSVMRFSGSAARAASITVPTEGMVTYLDDSNAIEVYNGAAWVRMETASAYPANYTAKGQILVGVGSGSFIAQSIGTDGQYLTASSGAPDGVVWSTPEGGAAGAWANVTSNSAFTPLTASLKPGFYKISTNTATNFTSAQFRFATSSSVLYGASLTNGAGFFSLPVAASFVNVTTGAPLTVLIEEVPALTAALPVGPSMSGVAIPTFTNASFTASVAPTSQGLGFWQLDTGSFNSLAASATSASFISALSASPTSLGAVQNLVFVQRAANGLWGLGTTASVRWPFQVFNANGTYTPPAWSTAVDVVVVAGGGGGGTGFSVGGGGGAGGASLWTNLATPASVSVTVGGGGAVGANANVAGSNGSNSSFGANTVTGGGGGGGGTSANGANGGSGGGAGTTGGGVVGSGTPGQGNPGGVGTSSGTNRSGSGGGHAASGTADVGGSGTVFFGIPLAGGGGGSFAPGGLGGGGGQNTPGTANTGGGGGGGNGAPGGSGVVVVRAR